MLPPDGAPPASQLPAGRRRGSAVGNPARGDRPRRADRVGSRLRGDRRARRRRRRDPGRGLLRLHPLQGRAVTRAGGLFATPRPEPGRLLPLAGGALVVALALVVFLLAGWSIAGWALGAVLWGAVKGIDFLLAHLRARTGSLAAS